MFEQVIVNGGPGRRRQAIVGINYKKLNDMAIEPTQGSAAAAGLDLHAAIDSPIEIKPHETAKVGTGLSFELPEETFGAIFARSGLATKEGIRPANCVGVCDSDYRGEYIVALHNDSEETRTINPGDRIAQLVIMPYIPVTLVETKELSETERGDGGFGSTGK
jgi:dUTP pyrophosphatase